MALLKCLLLEALTSLKCGWVAFKMYRRDIFQIRSPLGSNYSQKIFSSKPQVDQKIDPQDEPFTSKIESLR